MGLIDEKQVMKEELADECNYIWEAACLWSFGSQERLGGDSRFKVLWIWEGSTNVTDCPAYLTLSFLFRLSRSVPVRDSRPLCPLLAYLSMDCSCIFQRLPYVSLGFPLVPWSSMTFSYLLVASMCTCI